MIRAVIFDCFGVLVTETWSNFKQEQLGHDPELMQQGSDLLTQANAGLITHLDFEQRVAELAGLSLEDFRAIIDDTPANKPLFGYITELKLRYKIGMLSNAADDWLSHLFDESQLALFDGIVLSYEAGVIKPDARAYELIAERLEVPIENCVFIDDQERFCTAAKEAGMQAVVYRDFQQMKAELEEVLKQS